MCASHMGLEKGDTLALAGQTGLFSGSPVVRPGTSPYFDTSHTFPYPFWGSSRASEGMTGAPGW